MFRTSLGKRTARGMAVGALILSISATTFGGSANAAPSADDTTSCSTLAHERNESVHRLHQAAKGFREQLKDLARDARELERDARRTKGATEMTSDARAEVADARARLQEIWTTAHDDIQALVELGTACKQPQVTTPENPHITLVALTDQNDKDNDQTVRVWVQFNEEVSCDGACKDLFTYTANDTATAVKAEKFELDEDSMSARLTFKLDEDVKVDGAKDKLQFTAGGASLKDEDGNAVATESEEPVELEIATNDLAKKYVDVVDQAIKDMQAVLDDVSAAVEKMTAAAQSTDDSMAAKVKAERAKEKDARTNAEHGKPVRTGGNGNGNGNGKGPRG
jgi:uncharacterized protein YukE